MASSFTSGRFQGFDSAGIPLSGGFLYTYAAGTLTPLATFTTQSGGVANANPVVLDSAGRAPVWLGASSYRMVLKTAAGVTVTDDDNISQNLGAAITFTAAGAGSVLRTMQDKARDIVHVKDFGAVGNGVTNDKDALQAAIDTGGSLDFGDYTYNLGNLSAGEYALLSTGAERITYRGNPSFICNTADSSQPVFLAFDDFSGVTLEGTWTFQDSGFSLTGAGVGARAIGLLSTTQNCTGFNFDTIKGTNVIAGLVCATLSSSYTVRGVIGGLIEVRDGYYGLNCANSGDNLNIAKIITHNCKRSYFVYGVDGHVFDIESNGHAAGGFRDILLNVATKSTRNIRGKVVFKSSANNEYNIAAINASNPAATYVMENIDIEYDDTDPSNANLYGIAVISSVPNSSAPETIATNTFNNLKFKGATRLFTGVTIASTLTNQCTMQVDKALWNPAATNDRTNGARLEDGEWLMAADYGDINAVVFKFTCADTRLFVRRFKMTIIDNQGDGNPSTYDHRYVNGIIRGFNTGTGGPVVVHATTEYDNTSVGAPGTYAVAGNGENIEFTFSGWSGSAGGRIRVWVEK